MRVLPHIFLAYVAFGLHLGLGALLSVGSAVAHLPWVAAAFIVTTIPQGPAPLVALLIGLLVDCVGAGPIGVHAVGYGLAGLMVSRMRTTRFEGWLTAVCAGAVVIGINVWLLGLFRTEGKSFLGALGTTLLTVLLGAALSWPLWKLRRRFVISESRF